MDELMYMVITLLGILLSTYPTESTPLIGTIILGGLGGFMFALGLEGYVSKRIEAAN